MDQPPESARAVISALTDAFADMPPALQVAGRYIIDHPREVSVQSMRSLAVKASVHPNAFVRVARHIGFEGYDDMRERFRDFVLSDDFGGFRDRARWLQRLAADGGSAAIVGEMATALGDNVERAFGRLNVETLESVCKRLLDADHVYVLGLGSAYGLAQQFAYVAGMAFPNFDPIPRHGTQPIDNLAFAGPGAVLIAMTFQPYRAETMTAVRLAVRRGTHVIGITDSATSPLALAADTSLVCPTHTPQFFESHAAVTGLLETLLALLVSHAGKDVQGRIENFHAERRAAGVYEEDARLGARGRETGARR